MERNVERVTYGPSKHIGLFCKLMDGISCNPGKVNCPKSKHLVPRLKRKQSMSILRTSWIVLYRDMLVFVVEALL
jgi:hypothetical protein